MAPQSSRGLVAIVEDDGAVLHSLDILLAAEGYRTLTFATAASALESRELADASCLIIDYQLPDFDGIDLLARLRLAGVEAPAMIIASVPSLRCRLGAKAAGALLLEKPLAGDEVLDWIGLVARPRAPD